MCWKEPKIRLTLTADQVRVSNLQGIDFKAGRDYQVTRGDGQVVRTKNSHISPGETVSVGYHYKEVSSPHKERAEKFLQVTPFSDSIEAFIELQDRINRALLGDSSTLRPSHTHTPERKVPERWNPPKAKRRRRR